MYCNYCGKLIQDDAAVCAYCGISEYFDIDVTVVRLVWLITAIMTCIGFIPYIIAWIVMPEEPLLLPAPLGAQPATNA